MVRTLTVNALAKANTLKGTEPLVIIKIEWSTGTVYYADKAMTIGAITTLGKIIDSGSINSQITADSIGEVGSINVTLDDTEGDLKSKLDIATIEGTPCTVYLHYSGLTASDLVTLLQGKIASDIVWDEGERTLSFNIETTGYQDNIVGYAAKEGDIANLSKEAVDVAWPLCFGKPLRVPALQIRKQIRGTLKEDIEHEDPVSFQIENGKDFPQGTPISIFIKGVKMTGSFDGTEFTPTSWNDAIETGLSLAAREAGDYQNDYSVFWLASSAVNIEKQYVLIQDGSEWMANYVESQVGTRCHCRKDWMHDLNTGDVITKVLLDNTDTISETAGWPRGDWDTTYREYSWVWIATNSGPGQSNYAPVIGFRESRIVPDGYNLLSGDPIRYDGGYNDLYVANLIQSSSILEVYGHRSFNSETILAPIPSSYYTVNLNNLLDGQNCTTLEFAKALVDYECEGWDGDVFVSLVSTADQNVSNIIKWILQAYTDLTADTTTFNSVRDALRSGASEKYPANFAVLDRPSAIELCKSIAWQSRCALILNGGSAYLKYLSVVPSTNDYTADGSAIEMKTLELGFTPTEDIVTKVVAKWSINESEEEGTERTFEYSNNEDLFGTTEEEYDFYIYNIEELVQLSAAFWGYRYSNSWRKAAFQSFMEAVKLEAFDTIVHDLSVIGTNTLRGVVQTVDLNINDRRIGIETIIASKSGDESGGEPIEDTKYWTGDSNYSINGNPVPTDPSTGLAEVDYEVEQEEGCKEQSTQNANTRPGSNVNKNLRLRIINAPNKSPRSTNFTYSVILEDEEGIQVSRTIQATISSESTDINDAYTNDGVITLQNGIYNDAGGQVAGGSGNATLTIEAKPADSNIQSATVGIDIFDGDDITFTVPSAVKRGTNFTVSATGPASQLATISIESVDASDGVNKANITFDGSGNYSATDWQITGGSGKGSFRIIGTYNSKDNFSEPIRILDTDEEFSGGGSVDLGDDIPIILSQAGSAPAASTKARRNDVVPGLKLVGNPSAGTAHSHATMEHTSGDAGFQVKLASYGSGVAHLVATTGGVAIPLEAGGFIADDGSGLKLENGTNGDVIYYNSGWQKLAKGTDGQVLTLASGIPSWAASTAVWKANP